MNTIADIIRRAAIGSCMRRFRESARGAWRLLGIAQMKFSTVFIGRRPSEASLLLRSLALRTMSRRWTPQSQHLGTQ